MSFGFYRTLFGRPHAVFQASKSNYCNEWAENVPNQINMLRSFIHLISDYFYVIVSMELMYKYLNFVTSLTSSVLSVSKFWIRFCMTSRFFISCAFSRANRMSSASRCFANEQLRNSSICSLSHFDVVSSKSPSAFVNLPLLTLYCDVTRNKFAFIAPIFKFNCTLVAWNVSLCFHIIKVNTSLQKYHKNSNGQEPHLRLQQF